MKRVIEVFKLPVVANIEESVGSVTSEEIDMSLTVHELASCSHFSAKGRVEARKDAAEVIAHAINHIDALVDALEACVKALAEMPAGEPVNESDRAYHQALDALNAYRGSK